MLQVQSAKLDEPPYPYPVNYVELQGGEHKKISLLCIPDFRSQQNKKYPGTKYKKAKIQKMKNTKNTKQKMSKYESVELDNK